ncbi:hypothetical protein SLS56_006647 [Neofusicoccum ribis]|uniref:Peptidase C14 caspase domain-containing protein n=1 Tax=Neofusicoccum ribis TaxID=45134 RepID=A0ABR3SQQ0_9PEZI
MLDTAAASSVQQNAAQQNVADESESDMQAHWVHFISKNMELRDGYFKVSVLIIKWADGLDQLQVNKECQELEDLFENTFKYETETLALGGSERTQLQLISGIGNFAHKSGGEDNLLIVYYAGHGVYHKDKHLLEFFPSTNEPRSNFNNVYWNPAERLLIDEVEADVLSIMDCCFSSDLVRNVVETGRTFEMLSASGVGQVTPAPGEKSFTRALIKCLKTLESGSVGGSFTTRDVIEQIQKERPLTPPALWRRIPGSE